MYTVIIIDDNPTAVRAIEKTTHWDMFECRVVGTASNGVEGIKLIQEKQPDIVITDIRMPGYDGLEMINLMQQAGIESSYIIISGYDDFAYARTALRLGVFDYLLKPVRTKDLERSLSNLLLRLDDAFESPVEEDSVHKQIQRIRSKRDSYSLLVQNAVRSIDLFDQKNLSLSSVAEMEHVSAPYLSKIFKQEVGVGFTTYVTMVKMCKAKSLLQDPSNKAYEVAQMLGYQDYTYFFQVYKRYFGSAPSDVRKHKK